MKAFDFELADQEGRFHKLSDYSGKWVVVYFYPKDDTPGCTKEACGFRDTKIPGAVVLGISKDKIDSHKMFAEKYKLDFPILSDPTLLAIKEYGAFGKKKFMGKEFEGVLRMTFLINPEGEIVKKYEKVNPLVHAEEIIRDLKSLR
jgi:peroxiredoxin Q/BCP